MHVVSEDGSPRGEKLFILWNPPVRPSKGRFWRHRGMLKEATSGGDGDKEKEGGAPMVSQSEAAAAGKGIRVLATQHQEDGEVERRYSSISEVAYLLAELVRHDIRTIAFCTTRKLSELVMQYALESLTHSGHSRLCGSIKSYRGGYTPEQRRSIEAELFGDVLRVSESSNACRPRRM